MLEVFNMIVLILYVLIMFFLQAISNESQHFVNGTGNSTPLASEISSLEDPTFKVGKLTVEERREKIHRYMKKRNERNFSKKIKVLTIKMQLCSRPCLILYV